MEDSNNLSFFEGREIRKAWHKEQWYFSIVDVIEVLTGTDRARKYWSDLKKKLIGEGFDETSEKIGQLKMMAADGKNRMTDVANTEGVLRIIMSIPSPKAEPFRQWMAQTSKERIEETENPEIGFERLREIYQAKGYSDEWIKRRIQTIEARKRLTDEWKSRGVTEGEEYSILTATIAKGTFGLTPKQHKEVKGLTKPSQNLRDHMTPLELIFTALGEETTRMIAEKDDAQGFGENMDSAVEGGSMAGEYRKQLEERTGSKVVSKDNFINQIDTNTNAPMLENLDDLEQ
jgi:DNA-damage-inducible protein D